MLRRTFNRDPAACDNVSAGVRRFRRLAAVWVVIVAALLFPGQPAWADPVRVATFNVMNYLCMDRRLDGRFMPGHPKPEREKAAVRAVLHAVDADVVCIQEIGPRPFLDELLQDLRSEGLEYPHVSWLEAADTMRHVAILSRIPFREVVPHDGVTFKYLGRQERVKRGMLEVGFDSASGGWSVFTMHLKSPLTEDAADPGAEKRRVAEARALRDVILKRFPGPDARFLIAGDLNDGPDSGAVRALRMRGRRVVSVLVPASDSRGETWTHRYLQGGRYERLDYVLVSPALKAGIAGGVGRIHDDPGALAGSDHRLVWVDVHADHPPAQKTKTPAGAEPAGAAKAKGGGSLSDPRP